MKNKIFILRDFAWEFNDGEAMSYRGFGEFCKKFDTYQAAFEQKKEAEIAIAQRGHENFNQLSGKVPYHEGIEKYWEYIKIHLGIDAKTILESNFVQQMQDSWKVRWLLIDYSVAYIKQHKDHIWNILQLIRLDFYEIQVFEEDKVFYKLYKMPNYSHRSRYWHKRGDAYQTELTSKKYSGELDFEGAYCYGEESPAVVFENLADAQKQIALFMENRAGRLDELSDAPELLQAYIEQNDKLHYDSDKCLLTLDYTSEDIPFISDKSDPQHIVQIIGLLPLLKSIHIPFYIKVLNWQDLEVTSASEKATLFCKKMTEYLYEQQQEQLKQWDQYQHEVKWNQHLQQERWVNLNALETKYQQLYNAIFGTFQAEFAQKTAPLSPNMGSITYLMREQKWIYQKETWHPTGLGVLFKRFNNLKTAQRKQKQMQLQLVREHFAVLKTVLNIHAGTSAIVKQVENYAQFIKIKFNFDIIELIDSLFQNNHYSQDINNTFKERLLDYTLKKFVLTNEIALSAVLEMVGLTFFQIQEVTTDTVFYRLVFNPDYDSKDDSPIWYHDDGTQASSNIPFMIYDTGLAAQTALANQLIYHRFDGSLEDLSNVPIFLEGLLGADLCYNPSQKSLFFDTPSSKHVEKARHLLLLLKPSKIPMRIEAVPLATSEALQLQWSEKAVKAYFDTQFNHIKGVIQETENNEWPF